MPDFARRTMLMEPGEPLLVAGSPFEAITRLEQWVDFTGMPVDHVMFNPLVNVPLPVYPKTWPDGRRRWAGIDPRAMWHPLLWLPDRVANRWPVQLLDADGAPSETTREDADTWAVRVALELDASGIYDQESGTWLDVLALAGLDADNVVDMARVEEWLAGAPDPDLDAIDLSHYIDNPADISWGLFVALAQMEDLRIANWASASDALLTDINAFVPEAAALPPESARGFVLDLAAAGRAYFAEVPPITGEEPESIWWATVPAMIDSVGPAIESLLRGPVDAMADRLMDLRDRYWPVLGEIMDEARDELNGAVAS